MSFCLFSFYVRLTQLEYFAWLGHVSIQAVLSVNVSGFQEAEHI